MKRYRVIVTTSAEQDILEAYDWLKEENPAYAEKWQTGLREKILKLGTLPESHPVAPESADHTYVIRRTLYGKGTPWRIYFTVEGKEVHILHVRHGRRDYWRSQTD